MEKSVIKHVVATAIGTFIGIAAAGGVVYQYVLWNIHKSIEEPLTQSVNGSVVQKDDQQKRRKKIAIIRTF